MKFSARIQCDKGRYFIYWLHCGMWQKFSINNNGFKSPKEAQVFLKDFKYLDLCGGKK